MRAVSRVKHAVPLWLAVLSAACGGGAEEPSVPGAIGAYAAPPNIVLITVDTLRADHLGCYGHVRDTTPHLDALAAEGVRFERSIATSATTLPAHLSLFTGLYPHQHGYLRNNDAVGNPIRVRAGRVPVAEALRGAGYTTAAFVSAAPVSRLAGFHAGFDAFSDPEEANRKGAVTTRLALRWLRAAPRDKPVFLWLHYWDPHEPNAPPEPYASMFAGSAELDALIDARRIDPARLQAAFEPLYRARHFHVNLYERKQLDAVPPIEHANVVDLLNRYDGDVRYTDDQIGLVLGALDELGLATNTIVVVTADHGQGLGQHDWLEHGRVTGENVHVPLIVRFPGDLVPQPQVVTRVVSAVDVVPSVLGRVGLPALAGWLAQARGEDVFGGAPHPRPFAFSQRSTRTKDRAWETGTSTALTFARWKLVHQEGGADELYDLGADPGETQDVAGRYPDVVQQLLRISAAVLADGPEGDAPDAEQGGAQAEALRAELDALGYGGDE
jgi:arylsulfatase